MWKMIVSAAFAVSFSIGTANALSLSTGFGGPPGSATSGGMFDIIVDGQDLTMTAVGANIQTDPGASVFIRQGSFVGNEFSAAGWTQIFSDPSFVGAGNDVESVIDVNDFGLLAGQTYGIAIFVPDRMESATGTGLGNVAATNADLSILEGSMVGSNFGSEFTGGFISAAVTVETTIYYDKAVVPVPAPLALLATGIVAVGIFARRKTN